MCTWQSFSIITKSIDALEGEFCHFHVYAISKKRPSQKRPNRYSRANWFSSSCFWPVKKLLRKQITIFWLSLGQPGRATSTVQLRTIESIVQVTVCSTWVVPVQVRKWFPTNLRESPGGYLQQWWSHALELKPFSSKNSVLIWWKLFHFAYRFAWNRLDWSPLFEACCLELSGTDWNLKFESSGMPWF